LTGLPARRIAGIAAAGLRLVPADPATTVGRVDVWADPTTGLPLQVVVTGRGSPQPAVETHFLDLRRGQPSTVDAPPVAPDGVRHGTATTTDLSDVLNAVAAPLPGSLAGRPRRPSDVQGLTTVREYGTGFATFAVLPLPGWLGRRSYRAAGAVGGQPVDLAGGDGIVVRTPLLNLLAVQADAGPDFLLAGPAQPDLLRSAAIELLARSGE
jgi:hypothetical protein